jgi:hypothetical protein
MKDTPKIQKLKEGRYYGAFDRDTSSTKLKGGI